MDLHYKQEVTVGVLVLAGIGLFVAGTMWLSGRSLEPAATRVQAQFADVGNMKRGNPVKVSGVALGRVADIRFEDVGRVIVTLSLDRRITPKTDATARMVSVGLVGDVAIHFDPGRSPDPLPADSVITGGVEPGLTQMGTDLGERAKVVLEGLSEVTNQRLADDLHRTLASVQRLADVFADQRAGPTAELTATLHTLQQVSGRMDSVLAGPALNRALANLDSVTSQLGRLSTQYAHTGARLDSLLGGIQRGEGTLGKLAADSTLYVQLRDLSASVKEFVDDLRKNPGKITVQVKIF